MNGSKLARVALWIALGLAIAALVALVLGGIVMWLWNRLMPPIFDLPEISYWQAVGLLILSHLLFRNQSRGRERHRPSTESGDRPPLSEESERQFANKVQRMMNESPAGN